MNIPLALSDIASKIIPGLVFIMGFLWIHPVFSPFGFDTIQNALAIVVISYGISQSFRIFSSLIFNILFFITDKIFWLKDTEEWMGEEENQALKNEMERNGFFVRKGNVIPYFTDYIYEIRKEFPEESKQIPESESVMSMMYGLTVTFLFLTPAAIFYGRIDLAFLVFSFSFFSLFLTFEAVSDHLGEVRNGCRALVIRAQQRSREGKSP